MPDTKKPKTIAFDFDGVISDYHGFVSHEHTGEPIPEIAETIRRLKALGHTVLVYSTRGTELIREYCNKYAIPVDYINDNPVYPDATGAKPVASVYVDDRGLCFKMQSADQLVAEILQFKPYWK